MAEATGVFFYVLPGCAAITAFTLAGYNDTAQSLGVPAFGGLMQIGFSFGFGIAFAIITCAATSGGVCRSPLFFLESTTNDVLALQSCYHDQSLAMARLPYS